VHKEAKCDILFTGKADSRRMRPKSLREVLRLFAFGVALLVLLVIVGAGEIRDFLCPQGLWRASPLTDKAINAY
jgi:hypothetical protein